METRKKFARESFVKLSREEDLDDVHARREVLALPPRAVIVVILLLKMDAFCEDIFILLFSAI